MSTWTQKLSTQTLRSETAEQLAWRDEGDQVSKAIYDENRAEGYTTREDERGGWVWADGPDRGTAVSWLARPAVHADGIRPMGAAERRRKAWALRQKGDR